MALPETARAAAFKALKPVVSWHEWSFTVTAGLSWCTFNIHNQIFRISGRGQLVKLHKLTGDCCKALFGPAMRYCDNWEQASDFPGLNLKLDFVVDDCDDENVNSGGVIVTVTSKRLVVGTMNSSDFKELHAWLTAVLDLPDYGSFDPEAETLLMAEAGGVTVQIRHREEPEVNSSILLPPAQARQLQRLLLAAANCGATGQIAGGLMTLHVEASKDGKPGEVSLCSRLARRGVKHDRLELVQLAVDIDLLLQKEGL